MRNKPEHIIIGTAGHIDHGKTAMIKALTGRDTDTLKEEKKRGISIDLGFTWFDLPDGRRAGVIDVPGHEKFLPNMLAGVCGMDLVLLVIALDEGIMPQTREHMNILAALCVPDGIIVLTKADLVDEEWADMTEHEIREELKETVFETWSFVRISAIDGAGIAGLREMIAQKAAEIHRNRNTDGYFRMPVDRVMSIKGLGTVIAGTIMEGTVCDNDKIMLYPSGKTAKIRSVQTHGCAVTRAQAGQRAAFLLSGITKEEVRRGCTAAFPESMKSVNLLDVKIMMFSDAGHVLKNRSRVHLHTGTSEILCRVVLLEHQELSAGEQGYAQLVLEEPLAVKKRDRFIIRFYSPLETIGGGIVLEEQPQKHKRFDENVITLLKNIEEDKTEEIIRSLLREKYSGVVDMEELGRESGIGEMKLRKYLEQLEYQGTCILIPGKRRTFCMDSVLAERENDRFCGFLRGYHEVWSFRRGVEKSVIKNTLSKDWEIGFFDAWMEYLESTEQIQRRGTLVWLKGFSPSANDLTERVLNILSEEFTKAGFDFRNMEEIRIDFTDRDTYREILEFLTDRKSIVRISEQYYTTPALAEEILKKVREYFLENETISYSSLRDLLGSSRRLAKAVMSYLDAQGVTVPSGKETERIKAIQKEAVKYEIRSSIRSSYRETAK